MLKTLLILGLCLAALVPASAQTPPPDDPNTPQVTDIQYNSAVQGTITSGAFYDWWQIDAGQGDQVDVTMSAADGLAPLIGILDAGGQLVARSPDGDVNGTVHASYAVTTAGRYTIVATRVGNANGTSTGSYILQVGRSSVATPDSGLQEVTFQCNDNGVFDVTTAATLRFSEDPKKDLSQRITVYGVDGFEPAIRLNISNRPDFNLCSTDARRTVDDVFTFPGEVPRTVTEDTLPSVSQLILNGADQMGTITLTIASRDGKPGRYMAIIEGFSITDEKDTDLLEVRIGPLAAKTTAMKVYMVKTKNSRLDPYLSTLDGSQSCDDAGKRGCETVPSFLGAGAVIHEGTGATITGTRSDAGLLLQPGNADPITLELGSRAGHTKGDYALVIIGELPSREKAGG
jgi:hypothetical protein